MSAATKATVDRQSEIERDQAAITTLRHEQKNSCAVVFQPPLNTG